jgi:hypothetical protein
MKAVSLCLMAMGLCACLSARAGAETAPARSRLGMNLSGPADWSTELPFVDVFRLSRKMWGSWGLAQYMEETEADQPKLRAVPEWNHKNPR